MRTCTTCGAEHPESYPWARKNKGSKTGFCRSCKVEYNRTHNRTSEQWAEYTERRKAFQDNRVILRARLKGSECIFCGQPVEHSCAFLVAIGLPVLCEHIWMDDINRLAVSHSPTPPEVLEMAGLAEFVMEKGVTQ